MSLILAAVFAMAACDDPGEDLPTTTPLITVGPSPPYNLTPAPPDPSPSVEAGPEPIITWGHGMPTPPPMRFGSVFVPVPPNIRMSSVHNDFGLIVSSQTPGPYDLLEIWIFERPGRSRIQFDERGLISAEIAPEDAADFQPTLDAIAQLGPQHTR